MHRPSGPPKGTVRNDSNGGWDTAEWEMNVAEAGVTEGELFKGGRPRGAAAETNEETAATSTEGFGPCVNPRPRAQPPRYQGTGEGGGGEVWDGIPIFRERKMGLISAFRRGGGTKNPEQFPPIGEMGPSSGGRAVWRRGHCPASFMWRGRIGASPANVVLGHFPREKTNFPAALKNDFQN